MVAYFKIYPHILVTVYMVLPWSKFTNYSCAHEHFHYSLSKYLHNTNTESSTYSSSGELALPSLLNAVKYLFGLGAQSETWQHIYCRNLFDLNTFQICPALCCSLDSSRALEALQSWSQASFSWYLKNKELSPQQRVKASMWGMFVQSHAENPSQSDQASPLALHIHDVQPSNRQTGLCSKLPHCQHSLASLPDYFTLTTNSA